MTIQPTDIAILLVTLAACIYCFVLSRRLKALQNTRDGLGATIMALSDSISAISSTTQESKIQAGELASQLSHLLEDAAQACTRVDLATQEMNSKHTKAIKQVDAAKAELHASLHEALENTKTHVGDLTLLVRQIRTYSGADKRQGKPEPDDAGLFDNSNNYGA